MIDSCNHITAKLCGSCIQKNHDEKYKQEMQDRIASLESENAALRESIAALEDKALDIEHQKLKAVERFNELREELRLSDERHSFVCGEWYKSEDRLAELREAAAWYWECLDLWEDGVSMDNPFWADAEYELSNNIDAAGSALRALLETDKSNQ